MLIYNDLNLSFVLFFLPEYLFPCLWGRSIVPSSHINRYDLYAVIFKMRLFPGKERRPFFKSVSSTQTIVSFTVAYQTSDSYVNSFRVTYWRLYFKVIRAEFQSLILISVRLFCVYAFFNMSAIVSMIFLFTPLICLKSLSLNFLVFHMFHFFPIF